MRNLFVNTSNHFMYLFVLSKTATTTKFTPKYKQNSKEKEIGPHPPIFYKFVYIHPILFICSFIDKIVHIRTRTHISFLFIILKTISFWDFTTTCISNRTCWGEMEIIQVNNLILLVKTPKFSLFGSFSHNWLFNILFC